MGRGRTVSSIDDEEAELVRRIFEMYIDRKSMPQVAFELNEEGLGTKRGREWSAWSVKEVQDDELYMGKYSVAGIEDHVEEYRIIEDELFEEAHQISKRYRHKKREMPEDRKKKIDRIFDQYLEFLDEMEAEESELGKKRKEMEIYFSAKGGPPKRSYAKNSASTLRKVPVGAPAQSLEGGNQNMWKPELRKLKHPTA